MKIGVYICHCGGNISDEIDIKELVDYARSLEGVALVRDHQFMCSEIAQEIIRKDIIENGIDRVVIAACSPRNHEKFFRSTLESAGISKYLLEVANIREQCSWVHKGREATEKAKKLLAASIAKSRKSEPLEDLHFDVEKSALVIGGGIAGITASLELANMGYKVYLVEKEPTIGGKMMKFDRIFPVNDCSSCMLYPLMSEVATHPNIELITYAEVEKVEGSVGDFTVVVRRKQTYVDWDKCIGCGSCVDACPPRTAVPSEFDEGLSKRKAMYIASPYAVPRKAVHDPEACVNCGKKTFGTRRFLRGGKEYLTPCEKACPTGAINRSIKWDPSGERIEFKVGTIVVCVGYQVMDKSNFKEYAPHSPNVITAMQFERILSPTGPTGGKIIRPSDKKKPRAISFISCVGSRSVRYHKYCSKVCCMYMLKQARLVKEREPDIEVYIHLIDVRAPGKDLEEYYTETKKRGVHILRGKVGGIEELPNGRLRVLGSDADIGAPIEVEVDLVVLATAIELSKDAIELARKLGISIDASGFMKEDHPKLRSVESGLSGIFIAGCCQGPKDIAETIAQAKAAAAAAATIMSKDTIAVEPFIAVVNESCTSCGLCENVCPYSAIKVNSKAEIDARSCKGCGICVAVCPVNAIELAGYTREQILSQIKEVI